MLTCVLGNVVQEERVLGEPLHLGGNDVLQLQAPAQWVTLSVLHEKEGELILVIRRAPIMDHMFIT